MFCRMPAMLLATWLTLPGLAFADDEEELTPEKIAAIRRDEQAAQAKVDAANGFRKSSEMSTEERRQAIRDQQAAGMAVMEKHKVSDKSYARRVARLTPQEREAVAREEQRLQQQEQAALAAARQSKADDEARDPEDIPIQTRFGDDNPVELESSEDAATVVEQGLPPDAAGEEAASSEESVEAGTEAALAAPAAPPAKKKKGRKK